jgi:hypothetical protein
VGGVIHGLVFLHVADGVFSSAADAPQSARAALFGAERRDRVAIFGRVLPGLASSFGCGARLMTKARFSTCSCNDGAIKPQR